MTSKLPAWVAPSAPTRPGAVDGEAHRQVLDRDVVDHLVVGALQEGRIDRAERAHALGGQPGGESHRVLLGDADVEGALGMPLGELVEAGAAGHRRGDRDDARVAVGRSASGLGEHVRYSWRPGRRLGLLAGDDVELLHAVVLVGAASAGA